MCVPCGSDEKRPKGKKKPSLGKTLELSIVVKVLGVLSENLGNSHLGRNFVDRGCALP
jgi:hypothetical protein